MIIPNDFNCLNTPFRPFVDALKRTKRIIDIGAGVRPCLAFPCEHYIAIEPHYEYADILRAEWRPENQPITVLQTEAEAVAGFPREDTTVLLLDVIEHMEKSRGERLRDLLEEFDQAMIFTPLGYMELNGKNPDRYGYNGGFWQLHRSGWFPEDFTNWKLKVWPVFHTWHESQAGAILALRQS